MKTNSKKKVVSAMIWLLSETFMQTCYCKLKSDFHLVWVFSFFVYTFPPHVSVYVKFKKGHHVPAYIFGANCVCQQKFVIQINEEGLVGSSRWKYLLGTPLVLLIWCRRGICSPFILMGNSLGRNHTFRFSEFFL